MKLSLIEQIVLCQVCENAYQELIHKVPSALAPVYIVGSEVLIPGGSQDVVDMGVTLLRLAILKDCRNF